ncbi:MAG TPA: hypothetical protein VL172_00095 [Kofleriaceae bacterium]|nr:hypothetical protein [Kofleriaceae bacterium]
MRISWLQPEVIRAARDALISLDPDWEAHFLPQFQPPPEPDGFPGDDWPRVAEHVARAERVSRVVREQGIHGAVDEFGESTHAIELATLVAAAAQAEELTLELLESLLTAEVDELIAYGSFLGLLVEIGQQGGDAERVVDTYERFCRAAMDKRTDAEQWEDRVAAVRDGLASLYVACGRLEEAEAIFRDRHDEQPGDLVVALAAARAFLSHGAVARAMQWLGEGAHRARALGRPEMEARLRIKQDALRRRLS